ncbi:MAG TPA: 3-deoxy-8-phosphooctulonate synthase [Patescibacteria group bacterium]|nr:3-deoxy-8-phosphooctulonate synthase [Patescibacteria group bacterium]
MSIDPEKFLVIAGPCLAESHDVVKESVETLLEATSGLNVQLVFKASYRKANRTSADSFSGIGDEIALGLLKDVREKYGVPVLTDFHSAEEAAIAANSCDVLQVPAFLSRQTDILQAAARTGKIVNIKKGQFMAPEDAAKAAQKIIAEGNNNVWLTERGVSFGYHDLVVDFRSLVVMKQSGFPVIYDATHSVQQPSLGAQSGGKREFIPALARAAVATGIDGIFFETHPDPAKAKSDSATQLALKDATAFLKNIVELHEFCKRNSF